MPSPKGYTRLQIALHWGAALLIVQQYLFKDAIAAAWDAAAADAIDPDAAIRADIKAALEAGEPASAIAKRLSQRYSRRRREVYALVLELQQ